MLSALKEKEFLLKGLATLAEENSIEISQYIIEKNSEVKIGELMRDLIKLNVIPSNVSEKINFLLD